MNEVSCRLFSALTDIEKRYGIPVSDGLKGVDVPRSYLENPRNRMDWDVFRRIMQNYFRIAGSARVFADMNRVIPFTEGISHYRTICQIAVSPATVYRFASIFIPRIYTPIKVEFSIGPKGTYHFVTTIDPQYEDCPEMFEGAVGPLETYPQLIGLPMARVEATITERRGEYRIFPPSSGTVWARTKRFFMKFSGFPSTVETLQEQNEELLASFEELERQSADFRAVLESFADGVAILRERCLIYANPALVRMLGQTNSEPLIGKPLERWALSAESQRLAAWLEGDSSKTGRKEFRFMGASGEAKTVEISPTRTVGWKGRPGSLVLIRDVTEQRTLTDLLARASHNEQQRIARDIHDGLGQHLTAVALKAKVLNIELTRSDSSKVQGLSEELVSLAREASCQARDIAHALAPADIPPHGLITKLNRLTATSAQLFGFDYSFSDSAGDLSLSPETGMQVYRAVQEALTNAYRHGRAHHVSVHCERSADRLYISVEDDGIGFPEDFDSDSADGMGLKIIRHRLASIGGSCTIGHRINGKNGVRILLEIPVPEEELEAALEDEIDESVRASAPTDVS